MTGEGESFSLAMAFMVDCLYGRFIRKLRGMDGLK